MFAVIESIRHDVCGVDNSVAYILAMWSQGLLTMPVTTKSAFLAEPAEKAVKMAADTAKALRLLFAILLCLIPEFLHLAQRHLFYWFAGLFCLRFDVVETPDEFFVSLFKS